MARGNRHYEIRPKRPCALSEKDFFSRALSDHRFYRSKLAEAISGIDIANNFIKGKIVGYLRSTCVIAVKVLSSLVYVKPYRTLFREMVYGLIFHITARK